MSVRVIAVEDEELRKVLIDFSEEEQEVILMYNERIGKMLKGKTEDKS